MTQDEAKQEIRRRKQAQLKQDFVAVMKTSEGRRVFSRIFYELKLMRDVSDPNGNTQSQNIGKQNAALWIYEEIKRNAGFDAMVTIWKEDMEQQAIDEKDLQQLVDKPNKEK